MATSYPGGLDSFTNPAAGDGLDSPSHAGQHANANDAIEAVQAELGTTPSGSYATVKARLEAIEGGTLPPIEAKGDLLAGTADNTYDNVTVGTNDTVLVADSSAAAGVKWANVTSAMIANGTIVDADVNASAAIARSKISGLPTSSTDNTVVRFDSTAGAMQTSGVVIDDNNRLTVVTGATGGYGFASGAVHLSGTGTPEGVVTAAPGSTWLQTDATTDVKGWIRWVKASGTGNTGWIAGPEADTGWRTIAYTGGDANWTGGSIILRRFGTVVHVGLLAVKMAAINTKIITLPAGFVSQVGSPVTAVCRESVATGNPYWFTISSGQVCRHGAALAGSFQNTYGFDGTFTYQTIDAWPTSLPGS